MHWSSEYLRIYIILYTHELQQYSGILRSTALVAYPRIAMILNIFFRIMYQMPLIVGERSLLGFFAVVIISSCPLQTVKRPINK